MYFGVSIHAPTRGATNPFPVVRLLLISFNPRTHTGCDHINRLFVISIGVSIHAPTRGATIIRRTFAPIFRAVSIHAPTRGATTPNALGLFRFECFNPRTHTGCDSCQNSAIIHLTGFNPRTHTGCDTQRPYFCRFLNSFNPRTHTGCDFPPLRTLCLLSWFQSTHPHGVRRGSTIAKSKYLSVSIHAPTRGATLHKGKRIDTMMFQSTHPHGVRPFDGQIINALLLVSIHAPTRGATSYRLYPTTPGIRRFNPRTHTGCDRSHTILFL